MKKPRIYLNENDAHAAAWLRELMKMGVLLDGEVDERSICDVSPSDLAGFTRCGFFAGVGGWELALKRAGWPDDRPCWHGSAPCQPFSAAGAGGGTADERHLWPVFYKLIEACRPPIIFGEQVSSAAVVGKSNKASRGKVQGEEPMCWYSGIHADLERAHYAAGALDIPAACAGQDCEIGVLRGDTLAIERGVLGPPHIRQRLYWFAVRTDGVAEPQSEQSHRGGRGEPSDGGGLVHAVHAGLEGLSGNGDDRSESRRVGAQPDGPVAEAGAACGMADTDGRDTGAEREQRSREHGCLAQDGDTGERVADTTGGGLGIDGSPSRGSGHADECSPDRRVAESYGSGCQPGRPSPETARHGSSVVATSPTDWTDFHLIPCLDGKARRAQPGIFPLAPGVPRGVVPSGDPGSPEYANATGEARTMRLRGYGNAIVVDLAAEFISTCMEVIDG